VNFHELVQRTRKSGELPFSGKLLALDPGQTTGWAYFEGTSLKLFGQLQTGEINPNTLKNIRNLVTVACPAEVCVFEDYRVYGWRAKQHAFSELHTTQLIGLIQTELMSNGIEYHKQMAVVAKSFATDDRLKEWGFWEATAGQKHARDAIRHGCHFITFGSKDKWPARAGRTKGKTVG
jgi:hypothetical protein